MSSKQQKVNYSPEYSSQVFFRQLLIYRHNDDLPHFNHTHYYKCISVLIKYRPAKEIFAETHIIRWLLEKR